MHNPDRQEIERLRDEGYTREEIADYFDVSLSKVKRWIAELGVKKKFHPSGVKRPAQPAMGQQLPSDYGMTVMERAKAVLGPRLGETSQGYTLDGRITNTPAILEEAGIKSEPQR